MSNEITPVGRGILRAAQRRKSKYAASCGSRGGVERLSSHKKIETDVPLSDRCDGSHRRNRLMPETARIPSAYGVLAVETASLRVKAPYPRYLTK